MLSASFCCCDSRGRDSAKIDKQAVVGELPGENNPPVDLAKVLTLCPATGAYG
jgi:hypothetical protein